MGKDFRTGLILGLLLAVATLVWVATRPSLRPHARMARSPQAGSPGDSPSDGTMPWEQVSSTPQPTEVLPGSDKSGRAQEGTQRIADETPVNPPSEPPVVAQPQAGPASPPDLTVYEQNEKIKTTRFHIVRRGETLSAISRQYYGSPDYWRKILTANQNVIKDPDRIAPGTKLTIPE